MVKIIKYIFILYHITKTNRWDLYKKYYYIYTTKKKKSNRMYQFKYIIKLIKLTIVLTPIKTTCLQRSIIGYIIFHEHGIPSKLAIGYYPTPFTLHMWVEDEVGNILLNSPDSKLILKRLKFEVFDNKNIFNTILNHVK